jgi:hypothetical protein
LLQAACVLKGWKKVLGLLPLPPTEITGRQASRNPGQLHKATRRSEPKAFFTNHLFLQEGLVVLAGLCCVLCHMRGRAYSTLGLCKKNPLATQAIFLFLSLLIKGCFELCCSSKWVNVSLCFGSSLVRPCPVISSSKMERVLAWRSEVRSPEDRSVPYNTETWGLQLTCQNLSMLVSLLVVVVFCHCDKMPEKRT